MSIALQSNNSGGDAPRRRRFVHAGGGAPSLSIYEDRRRMERDSDSCSSSSIGRNSDLSGGSSDGEDSGGYEEVQSSFKGPLDTMNELEEVLPIKRGMSKFYSGKSKSFTSLADAASFSSLNDIAKPENPYNKKRKNFPDKTRHRSLQTTTVGGGSASKRPPDCNGEDSSSVSVSASPPPSSSGSLPPLHPHGKRPAAVGSSSPPRRQSPWRSFSLSDLRSVCASTP